MTKYEKQINVDVLMCRHVCELLPATSQAHFRSSGTVGYDAFNELVTLGDVPVYVEVTEGGDARLGVLMNAPIRGVKKPFRPRKKIPTEYVVVFWEGAMCRRKISQPNWSHLPWTSIRYHYDVNADRTSYLPAGQDPVYTDWSVLYGSRATYIELRGFDDYANMQKGRTAVVETPANFLCNCPNLKATNLSDLRGVQVINALFMSKAHVPVDLSPFTNVHTIKTSMFQQYFHDSIDLSPLRNVVSIEHYFMNSSTIKSIDLSPFAKLESVGVGFLCGSTELESIDLSPLVSIKTVGTYFLLACTKLTSIDLTPLRSVALLGNHCVSSCTALISVLLPTFEHPDAIGSHFLGSCTALAQIDLSPFHNMTTIPMYFLTTCTGLTSLDLSPFGGVTKIEHGFLSSCTGLTAINLAPLRNVRAPLKGFMDGCSNIEHLNMSPMIYMTRAERQDAVNRFAYKGRITYANNYRCIM